MLCLILGAKVQISERNTKFYFVFCLICATFVPKSKTRTEMKKLFICIVCLLAGFGMQALGQTKAETLKEIRRLYAEAKAKIEQNGKGGKSPKDMRLTLNRLEDEDVPLYEMETLNYYFDEISPDGGYPTKRPYFIVEDWTLHGHLRYREVLLDPNGQQVIFSYTRGETDAGFVVESRYYYDAKGQCVEEKHNTPNSWSSAESAKEEAEQFLKIFNMVTYNGYFTPLDLDSPKKPTTPKAERMKHIRSTYAQAKEKIAASAKREMPDELQITIHDLGDDMPPRTSDIRIYFDNDGCYFISRHATSMQLDGYDELLFEPKTDDLIFSYSRGGEEGQVYEWRYYYDENGQCIETKSNSEETDDGFYDKRAAKDLQAIFHVLTAN